MGQRICHLLHEKKTDVSFHSNVCVRVCVFRPMSVVIVAYKVSWAILRHVRRHLPHTRAILCSGAIPSVLLLTISWYACARVCTKTHV